MGSQIVGVLDVDQNQFSTIEHTMDMKFGLFSGYEAQNKKIYMFHDIFEYGSMVTLDTEINTISQVSNPFVNESIYRIFRGSCLVENKIYFPPFNSDYVGVLQFN